MQEVIEQYNCRGTMCPLQNRILWPLAVQQNDRSVRGYCKETAGVEESG